jgi:hypothetical protein
MNIFCLCEGRIAACQGQRGYKINEFHHSPPEVTFDPANPLFPALEVVHPEATQGHVLKADDYFVQQLEIHGWRSKPQDRMQ